MPRHKYFLLLFLFWQLVRSFLKLVFSLKNVRITLTWSFQCKGSSSELYFMSENSLDTESKNTHTPKTNPEPTMENLKYAISLWTKDHVVKWKVGTHWCFLSGSASSLLNVWFTANPFPFLVSLNTYMKTWAFKKCYASEGYHILPFQLKTSLDICFPLMWFLQLQEGIKDLHSQFLECCYNIRLTVLGSSKYVLPKFSWLITERKIYNNWRVAS